jgi:hypothetical protein
MLSAVIGFVERSVFNVLWMLTLILMDAKINDRYEVKALPPYANDVLSIIPSHLI